MKLDLASFSGIFDKKILAKKMDDFLSRCSPEDPPMLSDLIVDKMKHGGVALRAIAKADERNVRYAPNKVFNFKIKVLKDEWGKTYKPGDKVKFVTRKLDTLKDGPEERNNARRMGTYEEDYLDIIEYEVDKKGCITCGFETAVNFLINYGLHAMTGRPLTDKVEVSKNVSFKEVDGKKIYKHLWYWRYQEVTPEQYKKLPNIDK